MMMASLPASAAVMTLETVPTLAIVAAGTTPNTELANAADLVTDGGALLSTIP